MSEEFGLVQQVTTPISRQESKDAPALRDAPVSIRIEGRVALVRQGLLAKLTGWSALCSFAAWVAWLMGVRRMGRVIATGDLMTYEEEFVLFGLMVRRGTERFVSGAVSSFGLVQERPMFPVLFGAAGVLVGGTWGVLSMVEGVVGRSTYLFLLGLLVVLGALLCDFVLFWVAGRLGRFRSAMVLRCRNRVISLSRIRETAALDLARSLGLAVGATDRDPSFVG